MPLGSKTARPDFSVATSSADAPEVRGSGMVARDKPEPAPRPSWAPEADRTAFDAAWDRERGEAEAHQRTARRAAFKAKRAQEQAQTRSLTFNRRAARQST